MMQKSFGQIIRDLRMKRTDFTSLRDFARRVGLSPAYLSRIENEKEPPPSEKVIERLAEALEADKYELFGYAGKVPIEFYDAFEKNPKGMASFLRTVREVGLSTDTQWKELEHSLLKIKPKRKNGHAR
jgi:HTH-type transcriptional regulator, competence development regulator